MNNDFFFLSPIDMFSIVDLITYHAEEDVGRDGV